MSRVNVREVPAPLYKYAQRAGSKVLNADSSLWFKITTSTLLSGRCASGREVNCRLNAEDGRLCLEEISLPAGDGLEYRCLIGQCPECGAVHCAY